MTLTFSSEELKIQMDKGQTIYKNRALTHNLQQPAQATNFLSILTSPGSQLLSISQTGRNSDHYLYSTKEGEPEAFPLFLYKALPLPCLLLNLCQNSSDGGSL